MSAETEIRESAFSLIKASSLFPVLFTIQIIMIFAGREFGLSFELVVGYMIMSWGMMGYYIGVRKTLTLSDMEDITYKKDPFTFGKTTDGEGITRRSFLVQIGSHHYFQGYISAERYHSGLGAPELAFGTYLIYAPSRRVRPNTVFQYTRTRSIPGDKTTHRRN